MQLSNLETNQRKQGSAWRLLLALILFVTALVLAQALGGELAILGVGAGCYAALEIRSRWRICVLGLMALILIAACALGACAAAPPIVEEANVQLPQQWVAPWQKAGAKVGWMREDEFGCQKFLPFDQGMAGDLPAFKFNTWHPGQLVNLPAPPPTCLAWNLWTLTSQW